MTRPPFNREEQILIEQQLMPATVKGKRMVWLIKNAVRLVDLWQSAENGDTLRRQQPTREPDGYEGKPEKAITDVEFATLGRYMRSGMAMDAILALQEEYGDDAVHVVEYQVGERYVTHVYVHL